MPYGQFSMPISGQSRALAQAAAAQGIPEPGATAAPATNDILALLQSGKLDPQTLMMLLSLLAGMGAQGVPGMQGAPQAAPMGNGAGSPIEAAYGG